jgi:polysaccharide biosynthesis protein PslA
MARVEDTLIAVPPDDSMQSLARLPTGSLPQQRFAIRVTTVLAVVASDLLLIVAATLTASFIRFQSVTHETTGDLLIVVVPTFLLAALALDCYRLDTLRHAFRSVGRAMLALAIAAGLGAATAFTLKVGAIYSRLEIGLLFVTAIVYLALGHLLYKTLLDRISGLIDPRILILGPATNGVNPAANIERIIPLERPNPSDPELLERTYAQLQHADRIIIAFTDAADRMAWAKFVRLIGVDAELFEPDLAEITVLGVNHWQNTPTLVVSRGALDFGERALKRGFDLLVSTALLVVTSPLLLLLMLFVKWDSPGSAIFSQIRVGRNNRRYRCYKLRTMYDHMSDHDGNRSTNRGDERITRIGNFLRSTSLDELPQLWNVIRGDMSLVGPRPHAIGSLAEGALFWETLPDYWTRHAMRPGITGLAQIRGLRGATDTRSDIEKRVGADLEYINSWSIWLDIKILLQTIRVVLHRNAF